MDELNLSILQELQDDFPLNESPYELVADRLQISASTGRLTAERLLDKVKRMLDEGIIRRLGASFDSNKLGFSSTLAAVSVEKEQIGRAAEIIGQFPEVTHSYLRDDAFNIWFTIIAVDDKRIENILKQICTALSLKNSQVLNLPAKRLFKLDARFSVKTT
jgi:DNA-binding Lrp family transcriptional regulator